MICFISFSHQFSDRFFGSFMIFSSDFDEFKIYFLNIFFPNIPMEAIRYSCPIRLDLTYILPAKEIRLLGKSR